MSKLVSALALSAALLCQTATAMAANLNIEYDNKTGFDFVAIKAKLETAQGTREERSRVALPNNGSYRIDVTGAVNPLDIRLELINGCLDFNDLSGLKPVDPIRLTVSMHNGVPRLEQIGTDGKLSSVNGKAIWFLNDGNRSHAVPIEDAVKAGSLDRVRELIKTTLPPSANINNVLFIEDDGKTLVFPASACGLIGVGRAVTTPSGMVAFSLRLPMSDDALKKIFDDFHARGYGLWRASLRGSNENRTIEYARSGKNAAEDFSSLREAYITARNKGGLREFSAVIAPNTDLMQAAFGKKPVSAHGAILYCGSGGLEIFWLPDITRTF